MEVMQKELAGVAEAAAASITPGMIDRMAQLAERSAAAIDVATSPEVLALLEQVRSSAPGLTRALQLVNEAGDEAAQNRQRMGLLDLLRALREPDVQFALKFVMALARRAPALRDDARGG